jgi:class 3 adenylate cyclase/tetratricopeptide (TPR) repeat protein
MNPPEARFCMSCGSPLDVAEAAAERRLVSVLFADLIGFTERSDAADPEDVRRTLVPFHTRAKAAIERYGGTLDKFIGDAAMGVFGAPVAHDNDPERAVLAGLDLLGSLDELRRDDPGIAIRVAVTTGEAVVSFGSGPRIGEAVAGDVVNTASRLQSVAPRDGLVIGEATWRAVAGRFTVEELEPVTVKGKAAPLRIWRVVASAGVAAASPSVELVGRSSELASLHMALDRVTRERAAEIVTVIGEPGLGKTRLLSEFRSSVGSELRWLSGTCVPYGEDATLRPLVDLVRAEAGIELGDDPLAARARVGALAARVEADPTERAWLTARLEGLLGVGRVDAVDRPPVQANESAAACARVVSHTATTAPVVVAIEDLHWAEPALRDAVRAMLDELAGSPVLIVCTARPDLTESGEWIGEAANASTLPLGELTPADTRTLLERLTLRYRVAPELGDVAERSGGNPLYAVEFVRMLAEAPDPGRRSETVPASVQAVVAARLDALPAGHRALLQAAAIFGTAFWPDGLRALVDPNDPVDETLEDLVRRGTVVRTSSSRVQGEPELGFSHALFREVSYGRLPRSARARKHLDAGTWLASAAGDRTSELADMLANHFATAAELAAASSLPDVAEAARGPAVRWLLEAGEAAIRADESGAFTLFDRARGLALPGTSEHSSATVRSAWLGRRVGAIASGEVLARFEEALSTERALGDRSRIGGVLVRLAQQLGAMGEAHRARAVSDEGIRVLEGLPAGPDLARAYAFRAEEEMFAGHVDASIELADHAVALGRDLAADEARVIGLHVRGDGRCSSGDIGGLLDLEEALSIAEAGGNASEIVISHTYIGEWRWLLEGPAVAVADYERAIEVADGRGAVNQGTQAKVVVLPALVELGAWDRALAWTDELLRVPERLDPSLLVVVRSVRTSLRAARGLEIDDDPEELVRLARPTAEVQVIAMASVTAADLAVRRGDADRAIEHVREFERVTHDVVSTYRATNATAAVRVCRAVGDVELAAAIVEPMEVGALLEQLYVGSAEATLMEMRGDWLAAHDAYRDAAEGWHDISCTFEGAAADLGRARCLVALGRREEARSLFDVARAAFVELEARPWIDEVDAASA